jgi:two-component SAPR family response regulator
MQNMNSFELYAEIIKIDDKVKVCFITAFEIYYGELKKKVESKEYHAINIFASPNNR